jgi:sugar lactone lactonase YvrE
MKVQVFRPIWWLILLSLFTVALLLTGTTPMATHGPLPDKFLFAIGRIQAPVGQFASPSDVAVAPDGTVYVADSGNHRIQRFSATGQFLGTWGSWGNDEGQFGYRMYYASAGTLGPGPSGVAVAPDGTVYVADKFNHRIQRFSPTGQFLGQWGSSGSGDGQLHLPEGVAVAPDGTVYVAQIWIPRIQRFSATGQFLGQWDTPGWDVAVAPDSTVYVATNSRIQRFSATGEFLGEWDAPAQGVSVAPDGTVYVADNFNHRIQRFSATGQFLGKWGDEGSGDGQFDGPSGVAVASDGMVYVADTLNHRIQCFSAMGEFLGKWGSYSSGDELWQPGDMAVAPNGTLYMTAVGNRIERFSAIGQFLGMWGSYGSGDGQFDGPSGVAVAPDGIVYVADGGNHRVQHFNATGEFLGKWGSQGSGDGQFDGPGDVAVAPDGTVYVGDRGNHRIQRFSASGQFLGTWGSYGTGDGQFTTGPDDVAVAPDGTVYVTELYAAGYWTRIQRFTATGQFLGRWGTSWPGGMAVAPDGTVYVTQYYDSHPKPYGPYGIHFVECFSATGQLLGQWGSGGSGDGQFDEPSGVAVAPDGTVYVMDRYNYRAQAFGPAYPATWRGECFANRWLAERPLVITQTAEVDFDWGMGAPDPILPTDGFSARWQRYVWFEAGIYGFTVQADDGFRLWVDGRLLVDQWEGPAGTYSVTVFLATGAHPVRLEYNDISGLAAVRLRWVPAHRVYLPLVMKGYSPLPAPVTGTWQTYANGDDVRALAVQGNYVWAGTWGGAIRWDSRDGSYLQYLYPQDGLAENDVLAVAVDPAGRVWFGTYSKGVSVFDGQAWTTYNTANSGLVSNQVNALATDGQGRLWIGTPSGLSVFDGQG